MENCKMYFGLANLLFKGYLALTSHSLLCRVRDKALGCSWNEGGCVLYKTLLSVL